MNICQNSKHLWQENERLHWYQSDDRPLWKNAVLTRVNSELFRSEEIPTELEFVLKRALNERKNACLWPAQGRPSHAFFDMDQTICPGESLVELGEFLGISSDLESATQKAMAGEINFSNSLASRLTFFANQTYDSVLEHAARTKARKGALELVSECKKQSIHTNLLTGGFAPYAKRICADLGFDEWRANQFEISEGRLTGRFVDPIFDGAAKANAVTHPSSSFAVGDGANDRQMLQKASIGLGINPKPILLPILKGVLTPESGFYFLARILDDRRVDSAD